MTLNYKLLQRILIILLILFIPTSAIQFPNSNVNNELDSLEKRDLDNENELQTSNIESVFLNYSEIPQRRIFFDMSHEQVWSIWDTGFMGYSDVNMLLQDYYLEVATITTSISDYIANLTALDILFLNLVNIGTYTEDEITNITDFVQNGGKVVILGEHSLLSEKFNSTELQNPLLTNFDMEITPMNIQDDQNNVGNNLWITFNSSYFDLTNLTIMYGAVLNITGNAFAIANSSHTANFPNAPIMGGYKHPNLKGGKVFCCTDTEWLWNSNISIGGIHYGNNSELFLNVLDWFYDTNLSVEVLQGCQIVPEFNLFSGANNSIFKLNMTFTREMNVTAKIVGGEINQTYTENVIGDNTWEVNISGDGYVQFVFNKTSLMNNFSKTVYFFIANNTSHDILFLQNNYSRSINPTPDGLLKFAMSLRDSNYSVYATHKILNYSKYDCIIIANPLQKFSAQSINSLNMSISNGTRLAFFNSPFSSLDMIDTMALDLSIFNQIPLEAPINNISSNFGINFTHRIVGDSEYNINGKLYYPKILGVNETFYNLSCYMASIVNVTSNFTKELEGYSNSWGEDLSIFGTSGWMGSHINDINYTCAFAYTNETLAAGILNYFSNEYYKPSKIFNKYLFNWMKTGQFNKKYQLSSNQTTFNFKDIHLKLISVKEVRDLSGSLIPNGTLLTVMNTSGRIISPDVAPGIPGFQILIFNNSINLTCSSGTDQGLFELSIYNTTAYKIIFSVNLNFTSKPSLHAVGPIPYPYEDLTLRWDYHPGVKTYYIFKSASVITDVSGMTYIDNVSTNLYNDELASFWGTLYYVVVGSDYQKNTTISNCVYAIIKIKPFLHTISPNPNNEGKVILTWDPLIGAKTYYIYRDTTSIEEESFQQPTTQLLGNVSGYSFLDNEAIHGNTYYYAVVGSDYINSTISNSHSVSVFIIPNAPTFTVNNLTIKSNSFLVLWNAVENAVGYNVYLYTLSDFAPSSISFLNFTINNNFLFEDLNSGIYYLKVVSVGLYANSTPSEDLVIIVSLEPPKDRSMAYLVLMVNEIGVAGLIMYLYYLVVLKNEGKEGKKQIR